VGDYQIVKAASVPDLEHAVRFLIADGWVPVGGVAIDVAWENYAQAMYKATVNPKESP
jgi:hypothetical protein